ncbi:hypothetical protein BWK69_00710 [Candidatus Parcubacteria bacterium A4]|nr:MAG: hypothetical protein BWK69_00710 [Candidatus Parcubacteria bacterium A4]
MGTREMGKSGEEIAEKYLLKNGYKILDKNFVFRAVGGPQKAEIDIVAKKDDLFVFVEVKTAKENAFFNPENKVDFRKRNKIARAAEVWLSKNKIALDKKWQIDVIAIRINPLMEEFKLSHFPNI